MLGETADGDAVDLDRAQLRMALGLLEPGEHPVERVAARDLGETHVRERVERDVQSAEARLDERRREPADQQLEVAPDERLAAREPHLVDAHLREHAHEPRNLLEAEQLIPRQPLEPFRRHAIAAAEVALVRDGHA